MIDLLIENAVIVVGSGASSFRGAIGVCGDKIVFVGNSDENLRRNSRKILDAKSRFAAPGFIDIHRHADAAIFRDDFGEAELKQGLTTIVNGNCGLSIAPLCGGFAQDAIEYLRPVTGKIGGEICVSDFGEYLRQVKSAEIPLNVGMLVGAGIIRASICGYSQAKITREQEKEIHVQIEKALSDGAKGVSLGLGYAPECFCTTAEIASALAPLRNSGTVVTAHIRQEGDDVLESIDEMIFLARELNVPVHISHLKAIGKENWRKKIPSALEKMARAREDGVDISCDVYPYTAGSTQLIHILPHDFLAGGNEGICARLSDKREREKLAERIKNGKDFDNIARAVGWENIRISSLSRPENQKFIGKSVAEAAEICGKNPFDCACDLLVSENCAVTMIDFITCEEDILQILRDDFANVISDSTYPTEGMPHPRVYGAFARVLERYAKSGVFSLESLVAKQTSAAAKALRLDGKGKIAENFDADIVIFNLKNVRENGDYDVPNKFASGFDYVFVNGKAAISNGERTKANAGKLI